jgi:hypothetical protein
MMTDGHWHRGCCTSLTARFGCDLARLEVLPARQAEILWRATTSSIAAPAGHRIAVFQLSLLRPERATL